MRCARLYTPDVFNAACGDAKERSLLEDVRGPRVCARYRVEGKAKCVLELTDPPFYAGKSAELLRI